MKTKSLFLIVVLLIQSYSCLAQKQDYIWIFGDSCGINFSNLNNPTAFLIPNNLNSLENYNSLSDKNGNLLFYMTGNIPDSVVNSFYLMKLFNSQHLLMENGDSIFSDISETQGTIFIPFPNDSNKYYFFHKQYWTGGNSLYYSIIDLSFNNGLGKIISKNNLLLSDSSDEKLTAIKHGNGLDWWVITHLANSDQFNIYLISSSGISAPIRQSIGPFIPGQPVDIDVCNLIGQMKATNQGDKIVFVNYNSLISLFDFDRCSGIFNNYIKLGNAPTITCTGYYGCSFSPSGNRLYVSKPDSIFQYNLEVSLIENSKITLWVDPSTIGVPNDIGQHQLGPDGKIYIAYAYGGGSSTSNLNLSVINYPDSLGSSCNFSPFSFNLAGGHCWYGLPNLPNYNLGKWVGSSCDTITSTGNLIRKFTPFSVYPNPASDILYYKCSEEATPEVLYIYNCFGEEVFRIIISENSKNISIPIKSFSNGIYFWKVIDKSQTTQSGKIVVIH